MKKYLAIKSCGYVVFLAVINCAYGGSLNTSGQGARALSMGGAFTAVADDPSAVYYNPAGICQIDDSEIMLGVARGNPEIKYRTPSGAEEKSTKDWLGYWLFANRRITKKLSGSFGIYTPCKTPHG
jgi:long-chain fatty acid transport protein